MSAPDPNVQMIVCSAASAALVYSLSAFVDSIQHQLGDREAAAIVVAALLDTDLASSVHEQLARLGRRRRNGSANDGSSAI